MRDAPSLRRDSLLTSFPLYGLMCDVHNNSADVKGWLTVKVVFVVKSLRTCSLCKGVNLHNKQRLHNRSTVSSASYCCFVYWLRVEYRTFVLDLGVNNSASMIFTGYKGTVYTCYFCWTIYFKTETSSSPNSLDACNWEKEAHKTANILKGREIQNFLHIINWNNFVPSTSSHWFQITRELVKQARDRKMVS